MEQNVPNQEILRPENDSLPTNQEVGAYFEEFNADPKNHQDVQFLYNEALVLIDTAIALRVKYAGTSLHNLEKLNMSSSHTSFLDEDGRELSDEHVARLVVQVEQDFSWLDDVATASHESTL